MFVIGKQLNINVSIIQHKGGIPEGQMPIVLDTLSNVKNDIYIVQNIRTENRRNMNTVINIKLCTNMMCSANSVIMSVVEVYIHSVEYSKLCNFACVSPYDRASIVSERLNQS